MPVRTPHAPAAEPAAATRTTTAPAAATPVVQPTTSGDPGPTASRTRSSSHATSRVAHGVAQDDEQPGTAGRSNTANVRRVAHLSRATRHQRCAAHAVRRQETAR